MEGGLQIVEGLPVPACATCSPVASPLPPDDSLGWRSYAQPSSTSPPFHGHRANPLPLLPGLVNPGQTPVEVAMGIQGALEAPDLQFAVLSGIRGSDAALLAPSTVLSAPEVAQAFALLGSRQFIPATRPTCSPNCVRKPPNCCSRVSECSAAFLRTRHRRALCAGQRFDSLPAARWRDQSMFSSGCAWRIPRLELLNDRLNIAGTVGAQGMDGLSLEGSNSVAA